MTLQYIIIGGQLYFDKQVFAREMLLTTSPVKKLLQISEGKATKPVLLTKTDSQVVIDYNNASDVVLGEYFYDMLKELKLKYKDKVKGRVVIRINALTPYHVTLDLNNDDGSVVYE